MTAATKSLDTKQLGNQPIPSLMNLPVAAETTIFGGSMVAVNSAGNAVPASADNTLKVVGRAEADVDNRASQGGTGLAGALRVAITQGVFKYANSAGVDAITVAHLGKAVFAKDDATVALTPGGNSRPVAGVVVKVDSDGVYVQLAQDAMSKSGLRTFAVTQHCNLADLANTAKCFAYLIGIAGRIIKVSAVVTKPATTAAKAATLTTDVAGVACTGGVLALTSANMTPAGNIVEATALTALNELTAAQAVNVVASAVTAFVEGEIDIIVQFQL